MTQASLPVSHMLGTSMFLSGVTFATTLPYAAIVGIETLGLSNGEYATLVSVGAVVGAIASVLIGYVSDRLPDRRVLVLMSALMGVLGYGLIYFFRNALVFSVATALIIPFAVSIFSQSFSYVRAYYGAKAPARADFMVSLMRTIFSASWVIVPPLAGIVAATFEIFDVYLATSLAYLANGALFLLMMRDGQTRIPPPPTTVKHAEGGPRLSDGVLMGLVAIVVVSVAMRLVALSMPLLIVGELNGTTADVGLYAGAAALVEIPFMLMWGYLVGRYLTKEAAIVISSAMLGIYILLAAGADSVWDILLLQLLNGLAASALLSITISYIQDAVKGRIGLSSSFMDVIAILATLIGAAIFGTISAGGDYRTVLVFAVILAMVAALVMVLGNWRRLLLRLVPQPSSGARSG